LRGKLGMGKYHLTINIQLPITSYNNSYIILNKIKKYTKYLVHILKHHLKVAIYILIYFMCVIIGIIYLGTYMILYKPIR